VLLAGRGEVLYFPYGLYDSDVADPDKVANEFQEAHRVASDTCQYQFQSQAFNHTDLERGTHVVVMSAGVQTGLGISSTGPPVLTTANADLFQIPYARGLQEIDLGSDDWPAWTSEYPELVFVTFSFQYAEMAGWAFGASPPLEIRPRVRISIDGTIPPGAGPAARSMDGLERGTGLPGLTAVTSITTMAFLDAGSHRVSAMAGQGSAAVQAAAEATDEYTAWLTASIDNPPVDKVVIGNRQMTVIRFARGGDLGK